MTTRPRSVAWAAAALILTGVVAVVIGLAASAVSGCCGSPDPGDSTPTLYGLVVGVASGAAGVMLWLGQVSRWLVLGSAAAAPIALVVAAGSSSDLAALVPFGVVGWLLLVWLVSRERPAAWLTGRPDDDGA